MSLASEKIDWMRSSDVRPYVYVRTENRIKDPGERHSLDWFPEAPIYKNPLELDQLEFAEQIYHLEERAFGPELAMPRWVFYDCALVPGFVTGFAMRSKALPESIRKIMRVSEKEEWTPLSLFIMIPTMKEGEWVAHNLCSINSLLPKEDRFYGLGFLSKSFGLWYANVETCCGMTQWDSPAVKLHSHYGDFEILTAYTPVHSYAETLTYRVKVNTRNWTRFFTRDEDEIFHKAYEKTALSVDRQSKESLIEVQSLLERGEGPFFLSEKEIIEKPLHEPLHIFKPKDGVFWER